MTQFFFALGFSNSFYSVVINNKHYMAEVIFENGSRSGLVQVCTLAQIATLQLRINESFNFKHTQTVRSARRTYTTVYTVVVLLTLFCLAGEGKDRQEEIYILYWSNAFNEITKQRSAVNG